MFNTDSEDSDSDQRPLYLIQPPVTAAKIQEYIDSGQDIRATTRNDISFFQLAISKGSVDIVKQLLDKGLDIDKFPIPGCRSPLAHALDFHKEEIVHLLLDRGSLTESITSVGDDAIQLAVSAGMFSVVLRLIDSSTDFNVNHANRNGNTLLHLAIIYKRDDLVKLFLDRYDADISFCNDSRETCLHLAVRAGVIDTIHLFLDKIDINARDSRGNTCIYSAIKDGSLQVLDLLLKHHALPDVLDDDGQPPLGYAITMGLDEHAKMLIDSGALSNIDNIQLHLRFYITRAVSRGCPSTITALIDLGADVNFVDSEGSTLLHNSVRANRTDIAKILLDRGANVNSKLYKTLETPLHLAVESYCFNPVMIELLIDNHADIFARNRDGRSCVNSDIKKTARDVFVKKGLLLEDSSTDELLQRAYDIGVAAKSNTRF